MNHSAFLQNFMRMVVIIGQEFVAVGAAHYNLIGGRHFAVELSTQFGYRFW